MDAHTAPGSLDAARLARALRGTVVVFEGPDGSGKTTQMRRLKALLDGQGLGCIEVREPGGTDIGEQIRQVLLHTKAQMTLRCEMLLYMASRAQLVEEQIRPALARGEVVLADRYLPSTLAYQGSAGGIATQDILDVARASLGGCMPHLVMIFDVDEATAAGRINPLLASSTRKEGLDRIESRGSEFHRAVRQGYLQQARQFPELYRVIDASRTPDEIWGSALRTLSAFVRERELAGV
jgi:dTMP kinase